MISCEEFAATCRENGVRLNYWLYNQLNSPTSSLDITLYELGTSRHLRYPEWRGPLASQPIIGDMWESDTAALTLQNIVNATITPVDTEVNIQSEQAKTIDACSDADRIFNAMAMGLKKQTGSNAAYPAGDAFTHNSEPLFIRKPVGQPSALTLGACAINGIPIPAGSIVRIDTRSDCEEDKIQVSDYGLREISSSEISAISFVRLSLFAYPPGPERELMVRRKINLWKYKGSKKDHLFETTPEHIQQLVQNKIRTPSLALLTREC